MTIKQNNGNNLTQPSCFLSHFNASCSKKELSHVHACTAKDVVYLSQASRWWDFVYQTFADWCPSGSNPQYSFGGTRQFKVLSWTNAITISTIKTKLFFCSTASTVNDVKTWQSRGGQATARAWPWPILYNKLCYATTSQHVGLFLCFSMCVIVVAVIDAIVDVARILQDRRTEVPPLCWWM